MTTTDDPVGRPHPEDLLASYALDTLPELDAIQVETHLAGCTLCREEVAHLLGTMVFLSQAVERQTPPPGLGSRLMDAVGRTQSQTAPPAPVASSFPSASSRRPAGPPGAAADRDSMTTPSWTSPAAPTLSPALFPLTRSRLPN